MAGVDDSRRFQAASAGRMLELAGGRRSWAARSARSRPGRGGRPSRSARDALLAEAGRGIAGRGRSGAARRTAGRRRSMSPAGTCHLFAMKSSRRQACTKRASRARCARTPHDGSPASSPGRPAWSSASTSVSSSRFWSSGCFDGRRAATFSDFSLIGKIFVKASGPIWSRRAGRRAGRSRRSRRRRGSNRHRELATSRAAWTSTRVRCGYSTDHHAQQGGEPGVRAVLDRQALAVGLQVGVDHRQPGRRRGRVLRLRRRACFACVEVGQRQVVAADQRPDEGPGAQRRGRFRVARQEPLGVEHGAGLEGAVRRAPLVLGQGAELRVGPRQGRQPRRRLAVGADRLVQGPHRGEVVDQAQLLEPLLDIRRHRARRRGPGSARPSGRAASAGRGTRSGRATRPAR